MAEVQSNDLHVFADALLSKKENQISQIQIPPIDGFITTKIEGCAKGSKIIPHKGVTFRHYIFKDESASTIASKSHLKAGPVPYTRVSPGSKTIWVDMTGVFITRTNIQPKDIGVPQSRHFVDVNLDDAIPLIQIEENIYMIACEPGTEIPITIIDHGTVEL